MDGTVVRVAINGFGRIGRQVLRQIARSGPDMDVVVVNSVRAKPDLCAHLFKYDSVFGRYPGTVEHDDEHLVIDDQYDPDRHHVVSAASCTTNCLAPVLTVLHDSFGVSGGLMTTIHAFTRDQELLDGTNGDLRRARAATLNMTPTKTGAARAIDQVMPELAGRIVGIAVRVPIPDVSLVDLSATLDRAATVEDINDAFREAAGGRLRGVLDVTEEPLVSGDFHGDTNSAVMDLVSTRRGPGTQAKVLAWYDNEAGYSARVVGLCRMLGTSTRTRVPDPAVDVTSNLAPTSSARSR